MEWAAAVDGDAAGPSPSQWREGPLAAVCGSEGSQASLYPRWVSGELFVPEDFVVPDGLSAAVPAGAVLEAGSGGAIGCVYIYPARGGPGWRRAAGSSWVRADRAELGSAVYDAILAWLERDWPFDALERMSFGSQGPTSLGRAAACHLIVPALAVPVGP